MTVILHERQIQKTEEFISRRLICVMSSKMSFLSTKYGWKMAKSKLRSKFFKERKDENFLLTQSLIYFSLVGRSTEMF